MPATEQPNSVASQREPVAHEENEVASLSEEMVPSVGSSAHQYEHNSEYQHPFGRLVKETQQKTIGGLSFPSIHHLKLFIETMKNSFLIPGNDLKRHFQTAQEVMEIELASHPNATDQSHSAEESSAPDDTSENEISGEPLNAAFEQREHGDSSQMPHHSGVHPVHSTTSFTSSDENQDSGQDAALHALPHSAAKERSSYGSFQNGAISGETPNGFSGAPNVWDEDIYYKLYEHEPFFGEHFSSFSSLMTPPPIYPSNSPAQDFSYLSKMLPLSWEKDIQETRHTPDSKESLTVHEPPSGDLQREEQWTQIAADVLSAPNPSPLNSYGRHIYGAPKRPLNIPNYFANHWEQLSFKPYQPTGGEDSEKMNHAPTVHLPSVLSNADLSPGGSRGRVGVQLNRPQQPVRSHHVFKMKPSRSPDGYFTDQRVRVNQASGYNRNIVSHRFPNFPHMFFTPQRRGASLNGGFLRATGGGPRQSKIQRNKQRNHPTNVNKEPGNAAYWSPNPISAFKMSSSAKSGNFHKKRGDTRRPPQTLHSAYYQPSLQSYTVKSRNSYFRGKAWLSKTHYAPYKLYEDNGDLLQNRVEGKSLHRGPQNPY